MQGLSCFRAIIPNREVKFICLPCLVLLAFLFFSFLCFACFLGVSRFLVGIILILVKYFSFFAFRVLYRIISYPYHIIYLASISSYVFLFLCLKKCSVSYVGRSFIYVSLNRFWNFPFLSRTEWVSHRMPELISYHIRTTAYFGHWANPLLYSIPLIKKICYTGVRAG